MISFPPLRHFLWRIVIMATAIQTSAYGLPDEARLILAGVQSREAERVAGSSSVFLSEPELAYRGPAWFLNALRNPSNTHTINPRLPELSYDRAGDRLQWSGRNEVVASAKFDAASFFNVAPFQVPRSFGVTAPSALTGIKEFDGGGSSGPGARSWAVPANWAPDGVPMDSDDVIFNNTFLNPLPNVHLSGESFVANSIKIELTTNQTWALGANDNSSSLAATLILISGDIKRVNTANSSVTNIGASGTGTLVGVLTLETASGGFTITNQDTDGTLQIDAIISGTNKFADVGGSGTVVFGGANTYTAATLVHGGVTLLINGDQSAATGAVSVKTVGTLLGGTGTIGGAVTVDSGGSITGGGEGTVGALTLNSSLTFSGTTGTAGTYLVDFSGGTSDLLAIAGVLDLSGSFDQLTLNTAPNGTHSYVLATYGSVIGEFDSTFNIPANYELVYGTHSLNLVLVPVPEPGTWIGAALALAAIGWTQRKRLRGLVAGPA